MSTLGRTRWTCWRYVQSSLPMGGMSKRIRVQRQAKHCQWGSNLVCEILPGLIGTLLCTRSREVVRSPEQIFLRLV